MSDTPTNKTTTSPAKQTDWDRRLDDPQSPGEVEAARRRDEMRKRAAEFMSTIPLRKAVPNER